MPERQRLVTRAPKHMGSHTPWAIKCPQDMHECSTHTDTPWPLYQRL